MLGLEHGFETPDLAVISEQDILGDRLVRQRKRQRRAADVLTEATSLAIGDLVVHADHGIGRFAGLQTITALGAPHDCLELHYQGGDKLFLPVENIELLSRFGADEGDAQLDKLGGVAWQSRKARLKKRLREIANELIKIAALRQLREAPAIHAAGRAPSMNSSRASPTRRRKIRRRASTRSSRIWDRASPWTGSSAATSASARRRLRCAPPSSPP